MSRNTSHVGCSGWVYRHWRGLFYPEGLPQKRWFERYAEVGSPGTELEFAL